MADEQKLYFVTFPQPINLLSVITTIFLGFITLVSTVTQEKIRDMTSWKLLNNKGHQQVEKAGVPSNS